MKKCIISGKGAFTVEAAIIVPFVLMILAGLIYSSMIVYQRVVLVKVSGMAAQQAAEVWVDGRKDIFTGGIVAGRQRDSLYAPLMDIVTSSPSFRQTIDLSKGIEGYIEDAFAASGEKSEKRKLAEIRKALYSGLAAGILKPQSTILSIDFSNKLTGARIDVTVVQEIRIPLGGVKKLFSGSDTLRLEGKGTAVVARPAEYIRNLDLISEYAWRLGNKFEFTAKLRELAEKLGGE